MSSSESFKASVQRGGCKVKVLICAFCVFLKVITVLRYLGTPVLERLGLYMCACFKKVTKRPNVWTLCFIFRCWWVSAGRWCVSTAADVQEHFWQFYLHMSGRFCDGDTPGHSELSRWTWPHLLFRNALITVALLHTHVHLRAQYHHISTGAVVHHSSVGELASSPTFKSWWFNVYFGAFKCSVDLHFC